MSLHFNIEPNVFEALDQAAPTAPKATYSGPDAPEGHYVWRVVAFTVGESRSGKPQLKLRAQIEDGPYSGYRVTKYAQLPLDPGAKSFAFAKASLDDLLYGLTRGLVDSASFLRAISQGELETYRDNYGQNVITQIGSVPVPSGALFSAEYSRNAQGYADLKTFQPEN